MPPNTEGLPSSSLFSSKSGTQQQHCSSGSHSLLHSFHAASPCKELLCRFTGAVSTISPSLTPRRIGTMTSTYTLEGKMHHHFLACHLSSHSYPALCFFILALRLILLVVDLFLNRFPIISSHLLWATIVAVLYAYVEPFVPCWWLLQLRPFFDLLFVPCFFVP